MNAVETRLVERFKTNVVNPSVSDNQILSYIYTSLGGFAADNFVTNRPRTLEEVSDDLVERLILRALCYFYLDLNGSDDATYNFYHHALTEDTQRRTNTSMVFNRNGFQFHDISIVPDPVDPVAIVREGTTPSVGQAVSMNSEGEVIPVDSDSEGNHRLGWVIHEEIGTVVINNHAIANVRLDTTVTPDVARDLNGMHGIDVSEELRLANMTPEERELERLAIEETKRQATNPFFGLEI